MRRCATYTLVAIKRRSELVVFSMSFIDCICCGFGAMILLLVLSQPRSIPVPEPDTEDQGQTAELRLLGEQSAGERKALEEALASSRDKYKDAREELIRLRVSSNSLENKTIDSEIDTEAAATIERQLAAAKQTLTEEMRRLRAQGVRVRKDAPVGGIPVDSEYVVFVVDTSGSMQAYAWNTVIEKLSEVLDLYPKVKGMQVMDDQGGYMFSQYRGQWIPDTPARRRIILERMRSWQPFSNSSPVEGIEAAIRTFYSPDKKISIYMFGDDFTGAASEPVRKIVRRLNPKDDKGNPRVRIHAIGFPTQFSNSGVTVTGVRFANLMRILCQENGGAFVGLTSAN